MKKLFAILLIFLVSNIIFAQGVYTGVHVVSANPDTNEVFITVHQMPKFNGNLSQYLSNHITYPEKERNAGITGTIYVTFVVKKDGSISGVKLLRGVTKGHDLDSIALAVVMGMPKWIPGVQNGKNVKVQCNLPIHFELKDGAPAKPMAK